MFRIQECGLLKWELQNHFVRVLEIKLLAYMKSVVVAVKA